MARILIIDDDNDILTLLDSILKMDQHELTLVNSAGTALKLLKHNTVDIVITDILMPDIDGIELIKILKQQYPEIKVLAMSGGGSDKEKFLDYLKAAQRFGADSIIHKPLDIESLLETVHHMLEPLH